MSIRRSSVLAATVGLWLAYALPQEAAAQQPSEPPRLDVQAGQALGPPADPGANQQLADAVAQRLRQSGGLRGYHLDITVTGGAVELSGQVADAAQRDEVLRQVQAVPGVVSVRDRLTHTGGGSVTPTQAVAQAPPPPPRPLVPPTATMMSQPGHHPQEPTPIFQAPPGLAYASLNPPPLPPYAWPTVAPYNNYSRVAYPTTYEYNQWPFIGPMYPFPKVPIGWRSIQLEYYDGTWWYGKRATGHDWWRIRYW